MLWNLILSVSAVLVIASMYLVGSQVARRTAAAQSSLAAQVAAGEGALRVCHLKSID